MIIKDIADILSGKRKAAEMITPERLNNSIVTAISFGFIAAGIVAQFADISAIGNSTVVLSAAVCGGIVGKCIAI